jgi:HD superfamily phosphohydrolase
MKFFLIAFLQVCLAFVSVCNGINTSACHGIVVQQSAITLRPEFLIVNTIYGDFEVTEPVLIDLFNSPVMQRIKYVRQYGVLDYVIKQKKEYTRYEHCVGVWALLKMYGATLEEQIAGLLHDASHTVFSHVADMLFSNQTKDAYQDDIHEWYLKVCGIDVLLSHHDISLDAILHKSGQHKMLERDLPDICADRLEYNIQAGILTNMLTSQDIKVILNNIRYEHDQWFFVDKESAKKLALVSLFNTEHVWGGFANQCIYTWTVDALKRALHIQLLSLDDIHFSTDPVVWDKLWISNDPYIIECLNKIVSHKDLLARIDPQEKKLLKKGKFRGLNPLVKQNGQLYRLTDIDDEYRKEYDRVQMCVGNAY